MASGAARRRPASWLAAALLLCAAGASGAATPAYRFEIVATYPHDPHAFTQGLVWSDGGFYESLGLHGESAVRRVRLADGVVESQYPLPDRYFGEGLAQVDDRLVQLTWKAGTGFVYGADTLDRHSSFSYPGEGWGLVFDRGRHRLIMSDGTSTLRFLDPATLAETGRVTVTHAGHKITELNELEMVGDEVWANVWPSDLIARIDPDSGRVTGVIFAQSLHRHLPAGAKVDALNGIAYDAADDRLFVTGKRWPRLFEVRVVPLDGDPP